MTGLKPDTCQPQSATRESLQHRKRSAIQGTHIHKNDIRSVSLGNCTQCTSKPGICIFFFSSHRRHIIKVAERQKNEHYIWQYEAFFFLVALPKALSFEKRSITRNAYPWWSPRANIKNFEEYNYFVDQPFFFRSASFWSIVIRYRRKIRRSEVSFFDILRSRRRSPLRMLHCAKIGVIFYIFSRAFEQKKIKKLRPKMTKIASRGWSQDLESYNVFSSEYIKSQCLSWVTKFGKKYVHGWSAFILQFALMKPHTGLCTDKQRSRLHYKSMLEDRRTSTSVYTAWDSEIGTLTSLGACNSDASCQ